LGHLCSQFATVNLRIHGETRKPRLELFGLEKTTSQTSTAVRVVSGEAQGFVDKAKIQAERLESIGLFDPAASGHGDLLLHIEPRSRNSTLIEMRSRTGFRKSPLRDGGNVID
jgi:hypothetical protein